MINVEQKITTKKSHLTEYGNNIQSNQFMIFPAEVIDVITDEKHYLYKNDTSIGLIQFRVLKGITAWAKPATVRQFTIPYKSEIILIVQANTFESGEINEAKSYYYTNDITLWGLTNMNFSPSSTKDASNDGSSTIDNYKNSSAGSVKSPDESKFKPELEHTQQKLNRPGIKIQEGDTIYQSRWGSSFKFSSTLSDKKSNEWSSKGDVGDPITIIRVDRKELEFGECIKEEIEEIDSAIYLCSNHSLPIKQSGYADSFKNIRAKKYKSTNEYVGNQIIFISNRIVLKSREDDIILHSGKQISLRSTDDMHVSSDKNLFLGGKNVYLGDAKHTAVNGETLVQILTELITAIQTITVLVTAPTLPSGPIINMAAFPPIISKLRTMLSSNIYI